MAACAAGSELGPEDDILAATDAGASSDGAGNRGPASPARDAATPSSSSGADASSGGKDSAPGSSSSSGSSSGASVDTGAIIDVPPGGVSREVESCWDVGTGVENLALGAPLVLDFPAAWHVDRLLGTLPQNVPGVQVGLGAPGRRRVLVPLDTPVEWFLGFAVVVMQEGDDTANARSCFFDVLAPGWQHARTTQWFEGGAATVDKPLGSVSTAGGVVVEGYLEGDDYYRVELVAGAGDVSPVRTTLFDEYGLGAHVFENLAPGPHSFDLRRVQSNTLYHVHFTVVP